VAIARGDAPGDRDSVRRDARSELDDYDLVRSATWQSSVSRNFIEMLGDPQTPRIVFNTLYLVVGTTVIDTLVGLGLAV